MLSASSNEDDDVLFSSSDDRCGVLLAGYQTHIAKTVEPAERVTVMASLAGRIGGS